MLTPDETDSYSLCIEYNAFSLFLNFYVFYCAILIITRKYSKELKPPPMLIVIQKVTYIYLSANLSDCI